MPPKITGKNLSYDDSAPPPFLAALRAQAAGATGPDPILAAQRRSAKKRSGSEDAEDVPLVVDESGNVVNLEVDKDGAVKETAELGHETKETPASTKDAPKEPESKASIGGRKRKVGRVVGGAADDLKAEETSGKDNEGGRNGEPKSKDDSKDSGKDRKPKKKAKKIKLSFDEDEG